MSYEFWNAAGITVMALAGLWIFGKCVVRGSDHEKAKNKTTAKPSEDSDDKSQ